MPEIKLTVTDDEASQLARALRYAGDAFDVSMCRIADQVKAQLPKPRIPEPGMWGVVKAEHRGATYLFVNWGRAWFCSDDIDPYDWDDLVDPVLIREGI